MNVAIYHFKTLNEVQRDELLASTYAFERVNPDFEFTLEEKGEESVLTVTDGGMEIPFDQCREAVEAFNSMTDEIEVSRFDCEFV